MPATFDVREQLSLFNDQSANQSIAKRQTDVPFALQFIDLFCGIGGIRLGLEQAGFHCTFSSDINTECQRTYAENFGDVPYGDIYEIDAAIVPNHSILTAGFPCQPFSICGKMGGFEDTRGTLFFEICRIIEAKQPNVVLLENVKHLMYHDKKRTFATILASLNELGYYTEWKVLNAAEYGVPQNRERIIIIASKNKPFDFSKIEKQLPKPVLLPFLDTEGNFEYMKDSYTLIENPKVQEKSGLIFVGHRNKPIRKVGVRPGTEHLSRVHKQPNRIYSAMGIHPTLPSQETSGRFWILTPDNEVRKLTINECFRIMGFPNNFKRPSSIGEQYKQIGNSVCVPMIHAVAKEIKNQFFAEVD